MLLAENLLESECVQPIIVSSRPRRTSPPALIPAHYNQASYAGQAPLTAQSRQRPGTSAVLAGWICIGIGLLTIWFPPLCNVLFSVAVVMAIIALATHQVRQGLALLLSALAGMAICMLVFLFLVAGVAANIASKAAPALHANGNDALPSASPPSFISPGIPVPSLVRPSNAPPTGLTVATKPITVKDIGAMLRFGMGDDEIIADAADKQLVSPIGPNETAYLREFGAGDRLVNFLQRSPIYAPPAPGAPTSVIKPTDPISQIPKSSQPTAAQDSSQAQKDARIAELNTRINALDDQIRSIRTGEGSFKYYSQTWREQQSNTLDALRNDLRREKWLLEGR